MSCLQVKGFGKLSLSTRRSSIDRFPTRHVEALLGYLLLHQCVAHRRDALIELLWPHCMARNGRSRLSTVLWRLRCLFHKLDIDEHAFLHTTRDTVVFAPRARLQFDVESFEQQVEIACTRDDVSDQLFALSIAIDLYQDHLFTGIDEDWCLVERERLARKRLQALGKMMHCYMRQEAFDAAIDAGHSILEEDPLREEVHRALMYCHGRLGQRAQVAAQFQRCADDLQAEIQILPMPQTVDLYQQITTSLVRKNLSGPQQLLVKRAQLAYVEFERAGIQLHAALDALEQSNPPRLPPLN